MLTTVDANKERQQMDNRRIVRGKAVVVVGGATEVGRATAGLLAQHGARVFVTASSPAELGAVLTEVCQWGNEVHGMVVDLDHPEDIRGFFQAADQRLGGIDILINLPEMGATQSAGTDDGGPGEDASLSRCAQEGIERMQARGKGQIINVALTNSAQPMIPVTGSGVSRGMGTALRHQAQEMGIRMTTIEPASQFGHRFTSSADEVLGPLDIARYVLTSIQQPFQVDRVYLKGRFQSKTY